MTRTLHPDCLHARLILMDSLPTPIAASPEMLGRRIQQALQIILAGLEERRALSEEDTADLRRELRILLRQERIQIAAAEIARAERILEHMLSRGYRRVSEPVVRQVGADRPGDPEPVR